MNDEQKETLQMLNDDGRVVKETAPSDIEDGSYVFEGDGIDGPMAGYIETDGKVTWIVGG